jgi:hypothetical protein
MPKIRLTDIVVRNLKAPERGQLDYWDASASRFGVRVPARLRWLEIST